jgi:hypothetical protein
MVVIPLFFRLVFPGAVGLVPVYFSLILPGNIMNLHVTSVSMLHSSPSACQKKTIVLQDDVKLVFKSCHHRLLKVLHINVVTILIDARKLRNSKVNNLLVDLRRFGTSRTSPCRINKGLCRKKDGDK